MRTSGRTERKNLELLCSPKKRFEIRTECLVGQGPLKSFKKELKSMYTIHPFQNPATRKRQFNVLPIFPLRKKFLTIWQKKTKLAPPPQQKKAHNFSRTCVFFCFRIFSNKNISISPRKKTSPQDVLPTTTRWATWWCTTRWTTRWWWIPWSSSTPWRMGNDGILGDFRWFVSFGNGETKIRCWFAVLILLFSMGNYGNMCIKCIFSVNVWWLVSVRRQDAEREIVC